MTKCNPYREALIFGSFPVSFRYPSGILPSCWHTMRFRDVLNRILLPFRYPSGIPPACGQNKHFAA